MSGYLDAASGAPLHPVAREALIAALDDGWADPGRLYGAGRRARLLLDAARESVAESIGSRPDEVSFTPSGTTALHAAALGTLAANRRRGEVFVHSAVEHSALLHAAEAHVAAGGKAHAVGVDSLGRVDAGEFVEAAGRAGVAAAALQAANHEVGTTQPVSEIATALPGLPLIVDATQTLGHADVPEGWSALAADARTWGGPPGVGVLAVRTGTRWTSPYPADDRESGRVPGVPNVPAIVAAAASLRAVRASQHTEAARTSALIDRIRNTVAATVPDVEVLGDPTSPTAPYRHVLLPLCRRRGAAHRARSPRIRSLVGFVVHVVDARTVARPRRNGGADVRQCPGFAAPCDDRGRRRAVPRGAARRGRRGPRRTGRGGPVRLDCRGRRCPLPILDLARHIGDVGIGATITVEADDPAARPDIAAWCRMRGHENVGESSAPDGTPAYTVRRLH